MKNFGNYPNFVLELINKGRKRKKTPNDIKMCIFKVGIESLRN